MLETPQKLCTTRQVFFNKKNKDFSVKMYKTRGQSAGKRSVFLEKSNEKKLTPILRD